MKLLLEHERVVLFGGDSTELDLPENSVDAIVCDPPSSISFMGCAWDDDRGGFDGWTKWLAAVLAPSVRALRPGGYALLWALPRTSHFTARAVELAGLEIRDVHHDLIAAEDVFAELAEALDDRQRALVARAFECIGAPIVYHAFGSGFPKSLDISKAIDAAAGAERPVIGTNPNSRPNMVRVAAAVLSPRVDAPLTAPATFDAARWTGYGSALKPAVEHWILARKPLAGTYADNVLTHGTGALNIDACRIGNETRVNPPAGNKAGQGTSYMMAITGMPADAPPTVATGRWPAHLSLRHAPGCELVGTTTEDVAAYENVAPAERDGNAANDPGRRDGNATNYAMGKQRPGATHQVERDVYRCAAGCPVAELDAQSGVRKDGVAVRRHKGIAAGASTIINSADPTPRPDMGYGGKGGASRFFHTTGPRFLYVAKASRREKDAGLDHLPRRSGGDATDREDGSAGLSSPRAGAGRTGGARNHHCTTKSTALMRWLITLVVPGREALGRPGIVLDPFAGSGTTGVAALELGHDFVGCEQGGDSGEYWPILLGRIAHALKGGG